MIGDQVAGTGAMDVVHVRLSASPVVDNCCLSPNLSLRFRHDGLLPALPLPVVTIGPHVPGHRYTVKAHFDQTWPICAALIRPSRTEFDHQYFVLRTRSISVQDPY